MIKSLSGRLAISLMMIGLLAGGCGKPGQQPAQEIKGPAAVISSHAKDFDSADSQTKAVWDQIVASAGTKDYVAAITALNKLQRRTDLTPEQRAAVNEVVSAEYKQMYADANAGDANAANAIRKLSGGR